MNKVPSAPNTRGRHVVLFLLAAILLAVGGIIAIGMTGGSKHIPRSRLPVEKGEAGAGDASSAEAGTHAPSVP